MGNNEKDSGPTQKPQDTKKNSKVSVNNTKRKPNPRTPPQKTIPHEPSLSKVLQDLVDTLKSHERDQISNKKLKGLLHV